jgi:hypothetical protein
VTDFWVNRKSYEQIQLEVLHLIFEAVMQCISAVGGDGCGVIMCRHHRRIADLFESYAHEHPYPVCQDDEGGVIFRNNQQMIWFIEQSDDNVFSSDFADIFVCLPFAMGYD